MSSDITLDYENRAEFCLNSVYFSKEPINFLHGFFICVLLKQQQQNIFLSMSPEINCASLITSRLQADPFNYNLMQNNLILSYILSTYW